MTDSDQTTSQGSLESDQSTGNNRGSIVRFDSECVLIPDTPTKSPKILTKSYSLPLWKRRGSSSEGTSTEASPEPSIVVKLPVPNFRGRPPPCRHDTKPLSPCIIHRDPTSARPLARRASLSSGGPSSSPSKASPRDITVPLRSCCAKCHRITEESFKAGEAWKVKYTLSARRRMRRASMNDADAQSSNPPPNLTPSFEKIRVDEVDSSGVADAKRTPAIDIPGVASSRDASEDSTLFPLPSPTGSPSPPKASSSEFPWASASFNGLSESPDNGILDGMAPLGRKGFREPGSTTLDPITELNTPVISRSTSPEPLDTPEKEEADDVFSDSQQSTPEPLSPFIASNGKDTHPNIMGTQITPPPSPPQLSSSPCSSPEPTELKEYTPQTPVSVRPNRTPSKERKSSFSTSVFRTGADILRGVSTTMSGINVA